MGFLSKAWDSIKGAVKSIGKGIKKAAKSVGKFMNKIGVVGQIALAFILPGIGSALGGMASTLAASANPLLSGVGTVLQTAGKFASTVGNAYKTVTDGVMSFVKNVGGSVVNQTASLLGRQSPMMVNAPSTVSEGFSKWMNGVAHDAANIPSPFRKMAQDVTRDVVEVPYERSMNSIFEREGVSVGASQIEKSVTNWAQGKGGIFDSGVSSNVIDSIMSKESLANKNLFDKVTSYASQAVGKVADTTIESFSQSVGSGLSAKLGLSPEPKTEVTNISNVIPKFDSKPINQVYETNGFSYGALPNNRLQYFAASNPTYGDFGRTGFTQFSLGIRQ